MTPAEPFPLQCCRSRRDSLRGLTSLPFIVRLFPGQIYWLMVKETQTAVLGGISRTLNAGTINAVVW